MPAVSSLPNALDAAEVSALLEERYGAPAAWQPHQWNAVLDLLLSHRSIRCYLPRKLPDGVLESAIACAQSASTSSNLQAWSVVAVEDAVAKARLSTLCGDQKHITDAPLFLVWLGDLSRIVRVAEAQARALEALPFIETFVIAVVDAALAAQSAVLASESLGLGTCYIGGIRNNIAEVVTELNLPPHVTPIFGMTVGFPDPTAQARVKPRLPQESVLHREHYSLAHEAESIAAYDERAGRFFASQGQEHAIWSDQICRRLKSIRSLTGRDRLREAFIRFGFALK